VFEQALIHSCTIVQPVTSTGAYGNAQVDWTELPYTEPCRLIERQQRVLASESLELLIVTRYALLVGPDSVLRTGYRVQNVRLETGETLGLGFSVVSLVTRRGVRGVLLKRAELELLQ
jgi:hypothetical protein